MDETFLYLLDHDPRFSFFCSEMTNNWAEKEDIADPLLYKMKTLSIDYMDSSFYIEEHRYFKVETDAGEPYVPHLLGYLEPALANKINLSEFEKVQEIKKNMDFLISKSPPYLYAQLIHSDFTYFKTFLINLYSHDKAIENVVKASQEVNHTAKQIDTLYENYMKKVIQQNRHTNAKQKLMYNIEKGFMKQLPIDIKVRIMHETLTEYAKGGFKI